MRASLVSLGIAGYLGIALTVFAGMTAYDQYNCHHQWSSICDNQEVAKDKAGAAFLAALPPGWIASFVVTGAFYQGFTFTAEPDIRAVNWR